MRWHGTVAAALLATAAAGAEEPVGVRPIPPVQGIGPVGVAPAFPGAGNYPGYAPPSLWQRMQNIAMGRPVNFNPQAVAVVVMPAAGTFAPLPPVQNVAGMPTVGPAPGVPAQPTFASGLQSTVGFLMAPFLPKPTNVPLNVPNGRRIQTELRHEGTGQR